MFKAQFKAQAQQAHVLLVPHVLKAQQAHTPKGVCRMCRMRCAFGLYFRNARCARYGRFCGRLSVTPVMLCIVSFVRGATANLKGDAPP
jgi:hypothetical protein